MSKKNMKFDSSIISMFKQNPQKVEINEDKKELNETTTDDAKEVAQEENKDDGFEESVDADKADIDETKEEAESEEDIVEYEEPEVVFEFVEQVVPTKYLREYQETAFKLSQLTHNIQESKELSRIESIEAYLSFRNKADYMIETGAMWMNGRNLGHFLHEIVPALFAFEEERRNKRYFKEPSQLSNNTEQRTKPQEIIQPTVVENKVDEKKQLFLLKIKEFVRLRKILNNTGKDMQIAKRLNMQDERDKLGAEIEQLRIEFNMSEEKLKKMIDTAYSKVMF